MLKTKNKRTAPSKAVAPKIKTEQHVPSRHFERHPAFAIGPEQRTVTEWHTAILGAISKLDERQVETFDCPLYRFKADEDGQLKLVIEKHVTKPRTIVSGYKAQQQGSGKTLTDYTLVDDAFDLVGEGMQLPESMLREAIEKWATVNRKRLDGYTLLQLSRAFSLLIAARHGCTLGLTDL